MSEDRLVRELEALERDIEAFRAAISTFKLKVQEAVHREWPVGAKVRWHRPTFKEQFEAEGLVTASAGFQVQTRRPWVLVHMTKHPSLAGRLPSEGPLEVIVHVDELERLDD